MLVFIDFDVVSPLMTVLVLVVTCFVVVSPHVDVLKTIFHSGGQ